MSDVLRKRWKRYHWTVYVVLLVVLISIGTIVRQWVVSRRSVALTRAVSEAGGSVATKETVIIPYEWSERILLDVCVTYSVPTDVTIDSGSHPIPGELSLIEKLPTIKTLSLNTSQVGDYLVPLLCTFQKIEILDLMNSEISTDGALRILETLRNLKELHLSEDRFSREDIDRLTNLDPAKVHFAIREAKW